MPAERPRHAEERRLTSRGQRRFHDAASDDVTLQTPAHAETYYISRSAATLKTAATMPRLRHYAPRATRHADARVVVASHAATLNAADAAERPANMRRH